MYKDPAKWAMTFQAYVSLTMLEMHSRPTTTPIKLMERSIHSARYCFVEHMMRAGTLHPAQFAVLDEWFRFINKQIPIDADLIGQCENFFNISLLILKLISLICKPKLGPVNLLLAAAEALRQSDNYTISFDKKKLTSY